MFGNLGFGGFVEGAQQYEQEKRLKAGNRLKKMQIMNAALENLPAGSTFKDATNYIGTMTGDKNFFEDVYDEDMYDSMMQRRLDKINYEQQQMDAQRAVWGEQKNQRFNRLAEQSFLRSSDPSESKDTFMNLVNEEERGEAQEWWQNQEIGNLRTNVFTNKAVEAAQNFDALGITPNNYKSSEYYKNLHNDLKPHVDRHMETRQNQEATKFRSAFETHINTNALNDKALQNKIAERDVAGVKNRIRSVMPASTRPYYNEDRINTLANNLIEQNYDTAKTQVSLQQAQHASTFANNALQSGMSADDVQKSDKIPDNLKEQTANLVRQKNDERQRAQLKEISTGLMQKQEIATMVANGNREGIKQTVRSHMSREQPDLATNANVNQITDEIIQRRDPQITSAARVQAASQYEQTALKSTQQSRKLEANKASTYVASDVPSFYDQTTAESVSDLGEDESEQFNANLKTAYLTTVNTSLVDADEAGELYRKAAQFYADQGVIPSQQDLQIKAREFASGTRAAMKFDMTPQEAAQLAKEKYVEEHLTEDDTTVVLKDIQTTVGAVTSEINEYDQAIQQEAQKSPKDVVINKLRGAQAKHAQTLKEQKGRVLDVLGNPKMYRNYNTDKLRDKLKSINHELERVRNYDLSAKVNSVFSQMQPQNQSYNPSTQTYDFLNPFGGGWQQPQSPQQQPQPPQNRAPNWGPGSSQSNNTQRRDAVRDGLTQEGSGMNWGPQR